MAHFYNRVVRKCFFTGDDPDSAKNFDLRKVWVEDYLQCFAAALRNDLLGFAILSNDCHLILQDYGAKSAGDGQACHDNVAASLEC